MRGVHFCRSVYQFLMRNFVKWYMKVPFYSLVMEETTSKTSLSLNRQLWLETSRFHKFRQNAFAFRLLAYSGIPECAEKRLQTKPTF